MGLRSTHDFGRFHLDTESRVLTRDWVVVPIAPRTFDLLAILVTSKGRLLSKDDLLRTIWGDVNVEEASLAFQVSSLRKLLSDEGTSHPPQSGISQAANHGMGVLTSFPQPTLRSPGSWLAAGARPQDLRGLDAPLAERIGVPNIRNPRNLGISWFSDPPIHNSGSTPSSAGSPVHWRLPCRVDQYPLRGTRPHYIALRFYPRRFVFPIQFGEHVRIVQQGTSGDGVTGRKLMVRNVGGLPQQRLRIAILLLRNIECGCVIEQNHTPGMIMSEYGFAQRQ
jgi:hypothetical protein